VAQKNINVVRTVDELRRATANWRGNGQSIALVPTMGALHSGHMALVDAATTRADRTLVSIFVNPTQFAPHEDLDRYPRDEASDLEKLEQAGCHLVWAPAPGDMYPEGFATPITPAGAALGLEAEFRPHFFGAVATVCCKLFCSATPDFAMFGEKDYQQLCVVRQMVRDLNLPLQIVAVPTVREDSGLALSSRNAYLSDKERIIAPELYKILKDVAAAAAAAVRGSGPQENKSRAPRAAPLLPEPRRPRIEPQLAVLDTICDNARRELEAAGFAKVDYIAVREAETLKVVSEQADKPLRVLGAAWLGKTRLIDNVAA